MKPVEEKLTTLLRSRICALILLALSCASAFLPMPPVPELTGSGRGFLFASPENWASDPVSSQRWALALNLLIILTMSLINRRHNLLKTMSWLFIAMFAVMEAASPYTLRILTGGQVAALTLLWCLRLMYSAYHRKRRTRKIFMTFCLLSAGSMIQYGFVVFIPVMLIGCAQMRVFKIRSVGAALLGLITPWWIVFGLGLVHLSDISLPDPVNPLAALSAPDRLQVFAAPALTLLAGLACGGFNLVKVLNMNARMRALHGLLALTSIVTGLMVLLDYTNLDFYLPLLNACVAFQIGQFFRINTLQRGYVLVVVLLTLFIGIWIWQFLI